jgi:hypothetical protein
MKTMSRRCISTRSALSIVERDRPARRHAHPEVSVQQAVAKEFRG